MKKKFTILLTALSACVMVGCSNGNNTTTTKNTTEAVVESTSEVVTETEAETTEAVIHEDRVNEERETEPRMSNSEINSMSDDEWDQYTKEKREQKKAEREAKKEAHKKEKQEMKENNENEPKKKTHNESEIEEVDEYIKKTPTVNVASIDGEFSEIKIDNKTIKFGETTLTDLIYAADEDDEYEENRFYGVESIYFENGFSAYALKVEEEVELIYGISANTENQSIPDEYKTLTSLNNIFGESANASENVYEWNNDELYVKAVANDDDIKNLTMINKDVIIENIDIYNDYLKDMKKDLNDYKYESLNNLNVNIDELTKINLKDMSLEIGKTIVNDELYNKLVEEFGDSKYRSTNNMAIHTFENGLILRGLEIEEILEEGHADFILMSIGFRQDENNSLKCPIENIEKMIKELSKENADLWQNDMYEINLTKEDEIVKDFSVSLLEYSVSKADFKSSIYEKAINRYLNMETDDLLNLLIEKAK